MNRQRLGPFILTIQSTKLSFFNSEKSSSSSAFTLPLTFVTDNSLSVEEVKKTSENHYSFYPGAIKSALQKILAVEGVKHHISLTIHAAGIHTDGKGILVFGKSGRGKSTLAQKLSNLCHAGNDDNNLLLFPRDDKPSFSFIALPFHNAQKKPPTAMERDIPLHAAFLLEKEFANSSSITKIDDKDSVWHFLIKGQIQAPTVDLALFPQYNEMVTEFVNSTPFYLLRHNLNDSPEFLFNLISQVCND